MMQWADLRTSPFFRFIFSGGLNTLITFGIYLVLLQLMPYQLSYTIAYVSGVAISYALNRSFVFRSHKGLSTILLLPLVYVAQYGFGVLLLWLCVDMAGLSTKIAPLAVIAFTVPLTYILTRYVFLKGGDGILNERRN